MPPLAEEKGYFTAERLDYASALRDRLTINWGLPFLPRARRSIPLYVSLLNQERQGVPHGLVFQGRRFLD